MRYLVKFFTGNNIVDLENKINKFFCENLEKDEKFKPLQVRFYDTKVVVIYSCSKENDNYINMKKLLK